MEFHATGSMSGSHFAEKHMGAGSRGCTSKGALSSLRKCTAVAWPQICAIIPRHPSSSSHRKEAEKLCAIMAFCVRDHELLCLSSPYSHCQSRQPCVSHGLATQGCPMSASQDWAILRLQELTLTLSSLPHSELATYIVCSARDPTFIASVQREGNTCFQKHQSLEINQRKNVYSIAISKHYELELRFFFNKLANTEYRCGHCYY